MIFDFSILSLQVAKTMTKDVITGQHTALRTTMLRLTAERPVVYVVVDVSILTIV